MKDSDQTLWGGHGETPQTVFSCQSIFWSALEETIIIKNALISSVRLSLNFHKSIKSSLLVWGPFLNSGW